MAPLSVNQLNKLFKSRQILIEILKMRGFATDNYSDFSFQEFSAQFSNEQLDMLVESDDSSDGKEKTSETEETTKKVYVKYHLEGKLTNKIIYDTVEDLFEADEVLDKKPMKSLLYLIKTSIKLSWKLKIPYSTHKAF